MQPNELVYAWVESNIYPEPKKKKPLYSRFFVKYIIIDTTLTGIAIVMYMIIN